LIDFSKLRIVEIGTPHMAATFPQQTRRFSTKPVSPESGQTKLSVPNLAALHRALSDPDLSLIVTQPSQVAPWRSTVVMRALFDRRAWLGHPRFGPVIAPHLLRIPRNAPIAVIDTGDYPYINRADLFRRYWRQLIDKVRPISLGISADPSTLPQSGIEKTTDVFFAGSGDGTSSVRERGLAEIAALRDRGLRIDLPQGRLPPQEFYRRCAQAWLVWSPEGYEALACGSVPLINQPTIEQHRPLLDGKHVLYYDPAPGCLSEAIVRALADKDRLRLIAQDGKAHVLTHHTLKAIATYVAETTLADP
jgi:Glycosyl transferases group 1